jgi:lysozyme family protein
MLQKAVSACGHIVVVDGSLGPITIHAANAIPPDELLNTLKQEAVEHYYKLVARNDSLNVFLDGWLKRARA